jgi:peptidyl-prolyl cis-trans isomerase B (cyclophilin B)
MKKKISAILCLCMILSLALLGGCKKDDKPAASDGSLYLSGLHHVEIDVKDYGVISVELDADTAPITVTNFISLAEDGFYDGLTFHRIISGFMIQGGDPLGNGRGGSDNPIRGECTNNGYENNISHVRGTISMARAPSSYNSATSQFFIVHEDSTFLDGEYAAFGWVTDGMEVVDAICEDTPIQDYNGTVLPKDQPVINSIKVID